MKINSKAFLKKVQFCVYEEDLTILESILALKEKFKLDEIDISEILKKEKTLKNDLYAEVKKNNMIKSNSEIFDSSVFFN